ncbi:ubiquinol-cytochrome c reductase complex 14 kDa protein, partial [Dissophora ornata]
LRCDDVLREETDIIREAINRLPEEESYARIFRMKTAFQNSLSHTIATKENALKPEDDVRYLTPTIEEVTSEFAEK